MNTLRNSGLTLNSLHALGEIASSRSWGCYVLKIIRNAPADDPGRIERRLGETNHLSAEVAVLRNVGIAQLHTEDAVLAGDVRRVGGFARNRDTSGQRNVRRLHPTNTSKVNNRTVVALPEAFLKQLLAALRTLHDVGQTVQAGIVEDVPKDERVN